MMLADMFISDATELIKAIIAIISVLSDAEEER